MYYADKGELIVFVFCKQRVVEITEAIVKLQLPPTHSFSSGREKSQPTALAYFRMSKAVGMYDKFIWVKEF